ncbi:MAG: CAP domain-containing protein [Actinomycetota bacterium]|nr:CAP domain-containing protein [Actinomycetota bacterium]
MLSRVRKTTLGLAAAIAVSLIAAASASAACPGEGIRGAEQTEAALERSMLCLINQERGAAGVVPVVPNAMLEAAAVRHSSGMVGEGYFAHTSPAGVSFIDRIRDTGYTRRAREWLVGENLVWGSGSLSSPAELVEAWMNSPTHRANLLRSRFREIGIAAVRGTAFGQLYPDGVTVSSEFGVIAGKATGRAKQRAKTSRRRKG